MMNSTLKQMGHLSLKARCGLFEQRYGVRLGAETLRKYYLKAKVVYKKPKRLLHTALGSYDMRVRRFAFIEQLYRRIH